MGPVIENIIKIRELKGWSKQRLADELHLDKSAISRLESGKRELKVKELYLIAELFDMTPIDLITYPKRFVLWDEGHPGGQQGLKITVEITPEQIDFLKKIFLNAKVSLEY